MHHFTLKTILPHHIKGRQTVERLIVSGMQSLHVERLLHDLFLDCTDLFSGEGFNKDEKCWNAGVVEPLSNIYKLSSSHVERRICPVALIM